MVENLRRFKERREELGISLKEAEEETRIRIDYLRAIEEGDFDYIEAEVYLRGFLKVYSAYLGLDTRQVLEDYKKLKEPEIIEEEVIKKESFKDKILSSFDEHQNVVLMSCLIGVVLLIIGLLAVVGFKLYGLIDESGNMANGSPSIETTQMKEEIMQAKDDKEIKEDEAVEVKEENTVAEVKKDTVENNVQETAMYKEDNDKLANEEVIAEKITIQVETIDDSWYSVEVDGNVLFKGLVVANKQKTFSGEKIRVKIGNAAGIRVIKDGKIMGPFGSKGEVIIKEFSID
jgi:transcriptional regulator with XRE-family HTH domain